jgi:predicted RND superfamily exporter protein
MARCKKPGCDQDIYFAKLCKPHYKQEISHTKTFRLRKRAQVQLLFSTPFLIVLAIILVIIVLFLGFAAYFLAQNVFTLLGVFFAVLGALGLWKGFNQRIGLAFVLVGLILVFIPFLSNSASSYTLAAVMQ